MVSDQRKLGCCVDRKHGTGCTDATCMWLPTGSTCGDCAHVERCLAFGYTRSRDRQSCDFFPRRFAASEGSDGE